MGREFIDLFERWADSYDQTVTGHDEEYKAVFEGYQEILKKVAEEATGNVLEFGVGTGNLTEKLLEKGRTVVGVEPSAAMRKKFNEKFPQVPIYDGDFLDFPSIDSVNSIVSTYAFHHLTDDEKERAIQNYGQILSLNDRIVFADTVFVNEEARKKILKETEEIGYYNLLEDLKTEYYTTVDVLKSMLTKYSFKVRFTQMNEFVWLIHAVKQE
ncbi:class I SAM-dependent DNA methyltransferase [Pseudalkalibacillus caeni]|uniref:Uncharacterized methyltransferase FCL54_03105 n=1 Tax=Exobacillus caeni TaxID=2574798 RepID=A0A5R9F6U0_9BACL|nr:class I SAM-dependent methyltransferase [Pseudalkalibacillus caeni]TLS39307.1 class I SAM-dependent methyltransferase [Pseudalkalibacillus caeni]